MFLAIENKPNDSTALVDDTLSIFTYGDLKAFATEFSKKLDRRNIVFIMSKNTIGAVAGFYSCIEISLYRYCLVWTWTDSCWKN